MLTDLSLIQDFDFGNKKRKFDFLQAPISSTQENLESLEENIKKFSAQGKHFLVGKALSYSWGYQEY